ncbi:ROK family transcriptional regulator [Rhizobium sophorae]|uniref:ROK family transcriptional regulator n=1 Tax=Rhizobium sophorae TaxID=1535242 RepID=A0A7Y3S9P7_9HYPH|nr:ROK family transcriptional regulator [Rhizobium sophorae]MBX4859607.1 ROK family transcriptional regulator [Rhizobium bangladeshense]NKK71462.1 ROK family protein [Rhizobium leguminosarum bv. viciae]NNU39699.1 ROK family transcriptional regulator [Rhizobium sophorae]
MAITENAPPVLRQISVRAVMDVLLQSGPTSRAELSKLTGLSKQTMSEVIRTLEESGWVREKGVTSGRVGRTAITYEVNGNAGYAVGIDMGPTTTRIALVNIVGNIVAEREYPSDRRGGYYLIDQVEAILSRMLTDTGITSQNVLVAAVATPGVVDPATGALSMAPNLADIGGIDLGRVLSDRLGCTVVLENDVNAAVIGESWQGCAAAIDSVAFVSLGTGIGLGVLQDGKLMRGASGAAGEISYMPFGADPYADDSLERGALECAIGAQGITELYARAGGVEGTSVRDIMSLAETGDPIATDVIGKVADIAALLVVAVYAVVDPKTVVLGGSIGRHPMIVDRIGLGIEKASRRMIDVKASVLGNRATLVGALAIGLTHVHNLLFSPQILPEQRRLPPPPL